METKWSRSPSLSFPAALAALVCLVMLAASMPVRAAEVFHITMTMTVDGVQIGQNLVLGVDSEATDGYDAAFDMLAPPPPPAGAGDFVIMGPVPVRDVDASRLYTDYRAPAQEIVWRVQVKIPSGERNTATIAWTLHSPQENFFADKTLLLSDGDRTQVNMLQEDSYQATTDAVLTITYRQAAPPEQAATPTFTPPDGTDIPVWGLDVAIECATKKAVIYYTTDGSDPDETSLQYTAPIHITEDTTIRARAYADGMLPSEIGQASYTAVDADTTYEFDGDPGVWDLSGDYDHADLAADGGATLANVQMVLAMDAKGKITGHGDLILQTASREDIPMEFLCKGKFSSKGLVASLKLSCKGKGLDAQDRKYSVSLKYDLLLNRGTGQLAGVVGGKVRVKNVGKFTVARGTPVTMDLPDDMDGTWELDLADLQGGPKRVLGTATLTLSNGATWDLDVKGKPRGDVILFSMKGIEGARGAKFRMTTTFPGMTLIEISGKAFGQTIVETETVDR